MKIGRIRMMSSNGLFGFIVTNEGREYFFHKSDLVNLIWKDVYDSFKRFDGVNVKFEEIDTPKGPRAKNVELVRN